MAFDPISILCKLLIFLVRPERFELPAY